MDTSKIARLHVLTWFECYSLIYWQLLWIFAFISMVKKINPDNMSTFFKNSWLLTCMKFVEDLTLYLYPCSVYTGIKEVVTEMAEAPAQEEEMKCLHLKLAADHYQTQDKYCSAPGSGVGLPSWPWHFFLSIQYLHNDNAKENNTLFSVWVTCLESSQLESVTTFTVRVFHQKVTSNKN